MNEITKLVSKMLEKREDVLIHTFRVLKNVKYISRYEKADSKVLELAALLHDVSQINGTKNHVERSCAIAKKNMKKLNYPDRLIGEVIRAMETHGFGSRNKLKTAEQKILWDADKLDSVSLFGVNREFYLAGLERKKFNSVFTYYKKFKYSLFNTKSAKKIAKRRLDIIKKMLK
jgi:uncharacterized protein